MENVDSEPTEIETRSNLFPTTEQATIHLLPYSSEELRNAIEDLLTSKIDVESVDQVRQSLDASASDSSEWIRIPSKYYNQ